ncbi:MAG: hypothetical protein KKE37_03885 [Verrucomicrobia bacterium]|nr:hypothetical protein [Verrucomicrobiota bacterium]MBU4428477.1 hypothetical protein [Verrucomicrobiota bacterium]MCG2680359.1 hypothetical protein [Kiritimatiellia bacterium]
MKRLDLNVKDITGLNMIRPVTGGVPINRGAAPRGSVFLLYDSKGKAVPLQSLVMRRWDDDSAQWVLLDFQANKSQSFALSWSKNAKSGKPETSVVARRGTTPLLRTGTVTAEPAAHALLSLSERFDVDLLLTSHRGRRCRAVVESKTIEVAGPLRSTMVLAGAFYSGTKRVFGFRMRVTLFAGLNKIRIEPMILIDAETGMMQRIRDLKMSIRPRRSVIAGTIGGKPAWRGKVTAASNVRLFQIDDRCYRFEGTNGQGKRAPGWAEFDDGFGVIAVAMREFWQQWPKDVEINQQGVTIGMFPRFKAGQFKHMVPWYKHQYLFEKSCYRLRTGQTRRWEIWIDLDGNGEALAKAINAPLVPAADPARSLATGLWGDVAPAGSTGMRDYDQWADNLFDGYQACAEKQRDYGAMNWGDWFGERHVNWGNHEYDTSNIILTQFARTGDPKYFYAGHVAGRHTSEVDTIHFVNDDLKKYFESNFGKSDYPIRAGMMHEHCVGHVGGFYSVERVRKLLVSFDVGAGVKRPYLCLDPYNLGHVFTQGMAKLYLLTGDPWLKETVIAVGDNLAKLVLDRKFNGFRGGSHCGRVNGWTMLALAPANEIAPTKACLRAMKTLADDALSEQDPNCGGWLYDLPHGHCFCKTKKHVGEAGFIGCVRMNGLCRYYQMTGDRRIPGSLKRYIDHLINDTWDERKSDWRYTSCPASKIIKQIGVIIKAMVHSARITGDVEHIRILKKAWRAKFSRLKKDACDLRSGQGAGKMYTLNMYGSGEAAAQFAGRVRVEP